MVDYGQAAVERRRLNKPPFVQARRRSPPLLDWIETNVEMKENRFKNGEKGCRDTNPSLVSVMHET